MWPRRGAGQLGRRLAASPPAGRQRRAQSTDGAWWRRREPIAAPLLALGLDISTRTTGYCVLDAGAGGHVLEWGCVETAGRLDRYERAAVVAARLGEVRRHHHDAAERAGAPEPRWLVGAEDYARRWAGGRSNLFALAEANVVTTLACHRLFGVVPAAVHPTTARAALGVPTAGRVAAEGAGAEGPAPDVKERVLAFVSERLPPGFEWPRRDGAPRRGGRRAAVAPLCPGCFDVADAYIIAAYIVQEADSAALLARHAGELEARQAAYRESARYRGSVERASKRGGARAVRKYEASVTRRIERKLLGELQPDDP